MKRPGEIKGSNGTLPRRVTKRPKVRKYSHFDDPLSEDAARNFDRSQIEVAKHAFLPLLGYTKIVRRMDFEGDYPVLDPKPRDIRFASHTDSAIYSLYASKLTGLYDRELSRRHISRSVLAYRSGIGNNIDFAKSLFDEVLRRGNCTVLCVDIRGFFDNICHSILKENLEKILGNRPLKEDWIRIFARLTRYEYVLKEDLEKAIGKLKPKRLCDAKTFRRDVRPIIRVHSDDYGIPQGTPLSGAFANVFMLEFDFIMSSYLSSLGGSYRRYSDDIAIVVPTSDLLQNAELALNQGLMHLGLQINEKKTCITHFGIVDQEISPSGDELQYLGFTFDGSKILIRPGSMRNFYSRMKRGINSYIKGAKKKNVPAMEIRKRVPVGRFTHWGDDKNFVQYAYRASEIMDSPAIKRQLRRHVSIFDSHWSKTIKKHYNE